MAEPNTTGKTYKELLADTVKAASNLQKNTKSLQRAKDLIDKQTQIRITNNYENE